MPAAAVVRLEERSTSATHRFLARSFRGLCQRRALADARVRAFYPFVRITTATHARLDSRLSYGFVAGPGVHETSVTRPDLFQAYLTEQIGLLIEQPQRSRRDQRVLRADPGPFRLPARHQHRGGDHHRRHAGHAVDA